MKFELFTALKYIRNVRRTKFLSLITVISVVGIAIGVAVIIAVQSVIDGFQNHMKESILGANAHAHIITVDGSAIKDYEKIMKIAKSANSVSGVTPIITSEVIASAHRDVTGGIVFGVDTESIASVTDINSMITKGKLKCLDDVKLCSSKTKFVTGGYNQFQQLNDDDSVTKGVLIGKEMASYLGVSAGDIVTLISPTGGGVGPTGPLPLSMKFKVVGLFRSGMYEFDSKYLYMSIKNAKMFFSMGDEIDKINIKTNEIYSIDRAVSSLDTVLKSQGFKNLKVKSWTEMNQSLFTALKLERVGMFAVMFFIILVASFNIVSALFMLVIGKTQEISILRTMGATKKSIVSIFMIIGLILGGFGTLLGTTAGIVLCKILERINISSAKDVYYIDSIPVDFSFFIVFLTAFIALVVTFIAALYPSLRAADIKPSEGLRYE